MARSAIERTFTVRDKLPRVSKKNWGFGNVYQRGRVWWIYYSHQGRMRHESSKSRNKEDANKLLKKRLAESQAGTVTVQQDATTVDALLDNLLKDYEANNKSLYWARLVVNRHLRPFFGYYKASKVGSALISKYFYERHAKEIKNGTINRELALLRSAFYMGAKMDPPMVSKVPRIEKFKEDPARKGFFEKDAFDKILQHLPADVQDVTIFAQQTGTRKSEILAIRWPQVNFTSATIRLEHGETKNDEARILPMTKTLRQMLERRKQERDDLWPDSEWVFSRQGRRILDFKGAWAAACVKAGLAGKKGKPEMLFHDLRRTGVRNLIRAGVPEKVAMLISGHKTRSVFDRYHIVDERDLHEAARKLERLDESE